MFRKIILVLILLLGLFVQGQSKKTALSYETKVKNYVLWFQSLPDHKKREESNILVMKLNAMSANDRGIWLATAAKYGKALEVKKNIIDSLSNEGVKKKLFILVRKSVLQSDDEKVDTIVIVSSSTAKERTDGRNSELRKKIADFKVVIEEADRIMAKTTDDDKLYRDAEGDSEHAKDQIPRLRDNIITYVGTKDDRWNSYLIDEYELEIQILVPHKPTDEELDSGITSGIKFDKVKRKYKAQFIKGTNYYGDNKVRDDKNSSFNLDYYGDVKNKKESEDDNIPNINLK
jgi:hypothetical protein